MRTRHAVIMVSAFVAATASSQDYFPLKEGNRWTYTMSNGVAMTMKVTGFADVGGIRCAIVETDVGGQVNKAYYAADSEGLKDYRLEISGQEITYDPPILRIKLPFEKSQSWTSNFNQFGMSMTTHFESVGIEQIQTTGRDFSMYCNSLQHKHAGPGFYGLRQLLCGWTRLCIPETPNQRSGV